jgi:CDP-paratose 2-epimerase
VSFNWSSSYALLQSSIAPLNHRTIVRPPFLSTILTSMPPARLTSSNPRAGFPRTLPSFIFQQTRSMVIVRTGSCCWDYADPRFQQGIPEDFPIDQSAHSLFGASKLAADIFVQEYGRRFGIPTCCLRCGYLTGPSHAGVELHGFLSYLIRCNIEGRAYKVYGYKGKQVRDNIHSRDVAHFMWEFFTKPRMAEVYNLGGGKENSCSVLEAFALAKEISGRDQSYVMLEENRIGDHICYYSDLRKVQAHYPNWKINISLRNIVQEIAEGWRHRLGSQALAI